MIGNPGPICNKDDAIIGLKTMMMEKQDKEAEKRYWLLSILKGIHAYLPILTW